MVGDRDLTYPDHVLAYKLHIRSRYIYSVIHISSHQESRY